MTLLTLLAQVTKRIPNATYFHLPGLQTTFYIHVLRYIRPLL